MSLEEVIHNCGLCVAHTLHDTYSFIRDLQHRGREAAGIAAVGDNSIDVIKWTGTIDRFDLTDVYKIFPSHAYHTYMAHVRYATRGRKDKILIDAHPHVIGGRVENRGSHIIISDCDMAAVHNGQVDSQYLCEVDRANLKTECDTEALLHLFMQKGEYDILKQVPGSYTIAIADKRRKEVVVLRDKTGIKPGVLGKKDGKFVFASEDIALRKNGGEFIEDIESGHAYYLASDGNYKKKKVVVPEPAYCFFEWNYIADVDSILNGISVRRMRGLLGEALAKEFNPPDATDVTFLPRCPEGAASRYAEKTDKKFQNVFYKMRGERAFQGSTWDERKESIEANLHLLPEVSRLLRGQRIVCVDDSIVRGNNSRRERELLYEEAQVEKIYHANYTPPIGIVGADLVPRGCMFGVDMPPNPPKGEEFIARERSIEEISNALGMPVAYLSVEGMLKTFAEAGIKPEHLCTYCIGGKHPFKTR
jgi:amidophosphoribosyltransferase